MKIFYLLIFGLITNALLGRNVLLEFKGACFKAPHTPFQQICHKAPIFGPELTIQLLPCQGWHGFLSFDFLSKHGHSIGLKTFTKAEMLALGFGIKYLAPFYYGDAYAGLGVQQINLKTKNYSEDVFPCTSDSGLGAVVKTGLIFNLDHNLFIDYFADFVFVKVGHKHKINECCNSTTITLPTVIPLRADLSGIVFGIGLGYRF